jgi:hypothetical protein
MTLFQVSQPVEFASFCLVVRCFVFEEEKELP